MQVRRHERPGRYFHPPLATLITGAARLMLTLAELLAARERIDWLLCDTDSLAFARPDDMTRADFHAAIERVRAWFRPLSPYAGEPDLLELEDVNYRLLDSEPTDEPVQRPSHAAPLSEGVASARHGWRATSAHAWVALEFQAALRACCRASGWWLPATVTSPISNQKVLPRPGSLSPPIVPPMRLVNSRAIARPRPVPP